MGEYVFSDRAARALQLAGAEAARFKHARIDADHILLGIALEGEGLGIAALQNLSVSREDLVVALTNGLAGIADGPWRPGLPGAYTPAGRRVLREAEVESAAMGHRHLGTEHLLLGVLRTEYGTGAGWLAARGICAPELREAIRGLLAR